MPFCEGLLSIFKNEINIEDFLNLHLENSFNQNKIIKNKYSIDDIWHLLFDETNDNEHIEKIAKQIGIETEESKENKLIELRKDNMPQGYGNFGAKSY